MGFVIIKQIFNPSLCCHFKPSSPTITSTIDTNNEMNNEMNDESCSSSESCGWQVGQVR